MKEEGKFIIKDKNNEEKEFFVLATFEIANKNYVIYTDYSKNDNNDINIFSATYDEKWKLAPVVEKDKLDIIDEYIKGLEQDIKQGIKFA